MTCNICGGERRHYLMTDGLNVCQECQTNIVRIVVRDRLHYILLIFEAAAATNRQLSEEGDSARLDSYGV